MLCWRDHEGHAFVQLDARQGCDPHVEEDPKEHRQGDEAEHVGHHDGHSWLGGGGWGGPRTH